MLHNHDATLFVPILLRLQRPARYHSSTFLYCMNTEEALAFSPLGRSVIGFSCQTLAVPFFHRRMQRNFSAHRLCPAVNFNRNCELPLNRPPLCPGTIMMIHYFGRPIPADEVFELTQSYLRATCPMCLFTETHPWNSHLES